MADASNTGTRGPVTLPNHLPPMPAVARILSRFDRQQLDGFIAIAIDLVDALEPDADGEDDDPPESDGTDKDIAWFEWTSLRGAQKRGPNMAGDHEDDEEDDADTGIEDHPKGFDPESDICLAGDDRVGSGSATGEAYIHDHGPGDADDGEATQMPDDVPMLEVVSAEHNPFTDERVPLGVSNLMSSFRTNGATVRSADTGKSHRSTGWSNKPGEPV